MSMSTKIDDLPGPPLQREHLENSHEDTTSKQGIEMSYQKKQPEEEPKIHQSEKGVISGLLNEITEENVLVLVMLVIAGLPAFNVYLSNIPYISQFVTGPSITSIVYRSVVLLIVYILVKVFVLPKFKL